jgi:hypothetical protein
LAGGLKGLLASWVQFQEWFLYLSLSKSNFHKRIFMPCYII